MQAERQEKRNALIEFKAIGTRCQRPSSSVAVLQLENVTAAGVGRKVPEAKTDNDSVEPMENSQTKHCESTHRIWLMSAALP